MKFIELDTFFDVDDVDRENLGLPPLKLEDSMPGKSYVNIETITQFNQSEDPNHTTVQFVNGERWMYRINYNDLKQIIETK